MNNDISSAEQQPILSLDNGGPSDRGLIWRNVNIFAEGDANRGVPRKTILNDLSGQVKRGEFLTIMGATGSGKTTLLNYLSGRLFSKNLESHGEIILDNILIEDFSTYNNIIGYVLQEDILLENLTPKETLYFSAKFKLAASDDEINKRVNELISTLGLTKCQNSRIGSVLKRGISGGERKRTCIAVELITNPKILFLDEPTTGLDSFTALKVIETLKTQASLGRIIISTIHQPNSEIFNLFDRLLLMFEGNIVFQDIAGNAVEYFQKFGLSCPKNSNPAEYLISVLTPKSPEELALLEFEGVDRNANVVSDSSKILDMCSSLKLVKSSDTINSIKTSDLQKQGNVFKIDRHLNVLPELATLFKRFFLCFIRNPTDLSIRLGSTAFLILFCLLLFYKIEIGPRGDQNRSGLIFFIMMTIGNTSFQVTLGTFGMERPFFIKEQAGRMYRIGSYFWAKTFCDFPLTLLIPLVLTPCIYFACDLNQTDALRFIYFILITLGISMGNESLGLCISAYCRDLAHAAVVSPIIVTLMMLFSGFLVNQSSIPKFLLPLEYLSFYKYGYQAYIQNEWMDTDRPLPQEFSEGLDLSLLLIFILALGFRLIAYLIIRFYTVRSQLFTRKRKAKEEKNKGTA